MKTAETSGLRWLQLCFLAVCLTIICLSSPSWAQVDYYWVGNSGSWGAAANWNPNTGPPTTDDMAHLEQNDAINRTVSYLNTFAPTPTLAGVSIHASGTGTMTLELAQAGAAGELQAVNVWIGQALLHQTSGSLTVNSELILGDGAGSHGTYNLEGGDLTPTYLVVGNFGTGTFTQSEPGPNFTTASVTNSLNIGQSGGGSGTYDLLGGTLLTSYTNVGGEGTGVFTQSGGIHTAGNELYLGVAATGSGTYNLSGTGVLATSNTIVGNEGTGVFNQSGGGHLVANVLTLGMAAGSNGTYNLTAGALAADYAFIGYNGAGTFNQTGGSVTLTGHIGVGREAGSTGMYNLQGGTFNTVDLYTGWRGTGTFNQSGGTVTATGAINLAEQNTGRATYNLQGGTLTADYLYTGQGGIATFNQSPGTTLSLNYLYVDSQAGTSFFTQAGGATTVNNHIGVGRQPGSHGEYNLQGGTLTTGDLYVAYEGAGTVNQTGGAFTVTGDIRVGDLATATGTYNLQGGTLTANNIFVGIAGTGAFNQSGSSTATIANDLNLANGTYTLAGGTLNAPTINLNPGGIFNQTGGTLNLTNFNHQGGEVQGSLQNPVGGTYNYDSGTFTGRLLNYGTANFNADFTAGNGMAHFSALTLNAGRSLTFNGQGLTVDGGGLFTQTGGTLTVTNSTIGGNGIGTFTQTGGTLTVTNSTIGANGIGTFTQSGGTHLVNNILTLAANPGSSGTYNLQGGTLSAGTINLNAGGLFNRIGGTLNFTNLNLTGGTYQGDLDNQATVTGAGRIVGNFINRGTVNPGNSPGTLSVVGSFTQPAAGNYVVEVASATNYDKIAVTGAPGTATVGGTLTPTLLGGYVPTQTQLFPGIITATGGITGRFSTIASTLPWTVRYYANSIDLIYEILAKQGYNFADPSFPLTANQRNVGLMLNDVQNTATGDLSSVLDILGQLPGGTSAANAYQQITPDKASALPALSLAGSRMQSQFLNNRVSNLRYSRSDSPIYSGSGSGSFNASYSRLSGLMLAYNGADLGSLISRDRQSQKSNRWGLYTDFVSTMGNQNSSVNQTGYDFNTFGFFSGADYRLQDNLLIGLGSGYYHTASSFSGSGGSVAVNSIPFYAYGAYFPGSFYATGSIGYTLNLYGLERNLTFGGLNRVASSSVTGNQLNVSGETGYDLPLRGLILTPAFSLYYSQAWVGSFTESGANSLNLKVGAQSADSLQTGVGVRAARPFKAGNTPVLPQVSAFYQHEYSNNSRGMDARLAQTASTFNFQTNPPRRDFAVLGAGVAVAAKKNLFVQANYNAEVGRGNYTAHYVSAGLRWEF